MSIKYYEDEDGILRGICSKHGEFVGDAIGCPVCFGESEEHDYHNSKDEFIRRQLLKNKK